MLADFSNRDWMEDSSIYYHSECWDCKLHFHGSKYRRQCKECMEKQNEQNKPLPADNFRYQ